MGLQHRLYIQNLIALLMGFGALCGSRYAFAVPDAEPESLGVDACRSACARHVNPTSPFRTPTPTEQRQCYDAQLPECRGLTLNEVCQTMCPAAPVAPTAPASPPTVTSPSPTQPPPRPRKLTPEQKCHAQGKVYTEQPVLDADGQPTGMLEKVCIGQKDLAARLLKLEDLIRRLKEQARAPSSPEVRPAPEQVATMTEVEKWAEATCPPIPMKPSATLLERCEYGRILTNGLANLALSRAEAAEKIGQHVSQRVDDIITGKTPVSMLNRNPHLLLGMTFPLHLKRDFRKDYVASALVEVRPMLDVTPGLQFFFLGSAGIAIDHPDFVARGGFGLTGPVSTDVYLQGALVLEHHFRRESFQYYGPQLGIAWLSGASKRQGFGMVPGFGVDCSVGRTAGQTPNGTNEAYLDGTIGASLFILGL